MAKILIVDDEKMMLMVAKKTLETRYEVFCADSGAAAIILYKRERPDLILSDLFMPGMNGFEMYQILQEKYGPDIPIVFMTADDNADVEGKGFDKGAADFIRKPFKPEVLLRRIDNILANQERIRGLTEEATIDKLTGFLNKSYVNEKLSEVCQTKTGVLAVIDLDSFKLVNDIYGHEMGDKFLQCFADLVRENTRPDDIRGRIGGDEFVAFCHDIEDEKIIGKIVGRINRQLVDAAKKLLGEDMTIPLGVSVGIVFVPKHGKNYTELFQMADKALYLVKQNGKHGYATYSEKSGSTPVQFEDSAEDMHRLSMIMEERNTDDSALWISQDAFGNVYRFVLRYIQSYRGVAYKALFTLIPKSQDISESKFEEIVQELGELLHRSLRKSDIMMQSKDNQFFLLILEISDRYIEKVIGRVLTEWEESANSDKIELRYETELIEAKNNESERRVNIKEERKAALPDVQRVVVVDDDELNRRMAGFILHKKDIEVITLQSGEELLEYMDHAQDNKPDLILLDIHMPQMDGFETLLALREKERGQEETPVIFLTADDDITAETKGLQAGAMDFIKKPFVPEVLLLRVCHTIELIRLQKNLASEVEKKTRENESFSIHVVKTLANAIDAKDTYTNGHSGRVAEYARKIAERFGYNERQQQEIFMMGLLHDVGKIGVPDAVINKPANLTEDEFNLIRKHPEVGERILSDIQEMPKLSTGARWHHERYDGRGYPDGLTGTDIPEEARIITVADAYDAMTSYRSYRDVLAQEVVRREINEGKGTQFDPVFADIMLDLIAADPDYRMREQ